MAAAPSSAPTGRDVGARVQVVCKGIRDYLNRHENRCLLIVLGNSPLIEAECRAVFSRYGAIKKIKLTASCAAAFVDFECDHAPLLIARCFALRERNPNLFFPKGARTLLPACSVNQFLYLEGVPRELSTSALMSHFMKFNNGQEVVIHRPGSGIHLSSRVVVPLNGIAASDYTKHQKRLTSMMENNKIFQFNAIPQLEQLTNDRSIFEKSGCGLCKVAALKQTLVGLDPGPPSDQKTEDGDDYCILRAPTPNLSSIIAEIEKNLESSALPAPSDCHKDFEKKWTFPKPAKVVPPPPLRCTLPSRRSIPTQTGFRAAFDTGERWDDVPEGSFPIPWEKEEKKVDCRSPVPPPDPKQPTKLRAEELNWKNFGKEVPPPPVSQLKLKPKARTPIPSLISIAVDKPNQGSEGGEKDQPVVRVQPVKPVLRSPNDQFPPLPLISLSIDPPSEKERDTPNRSVENEGDSVKQSMNEEKPTPLMSATSTDKRVDNSSKQFDWRSALAAPEFVPRGKESRVREKKEQVMGEGTMPVADVAIEENRDGKMKEDIEKKSENPIKRWTRMSVVDHEEDEDQSMESEYLSWLTRGEVNARRDSLSSSDSEASIVPLPSSLAVSSWGRGIEVEEKKNLPTSSEAYPLNEGANIFGRVIRTFGRP